MLFSLNFAASSKFLRHISLACWLGACALFSCQPTPVVTPPSKPTAQPSQSPEPYRWQLPPGFPQPVVPSDNPMTIAKVELGRHLFYDTRLSLDQSQSCASCHQQQRGFSDGQARPKGVTGEMHPRNSMSLANLAYTAVLTWANPEMKSLETQMLIPLFGESPPEMGMAGKELELITRLRKESLYQSLFAAAFPESTDPFTLKHITQAVASFERSLVSANSPYDRYLYRKDTTALSASAKRGETLFFSERLECFHCHGGFNLTDTSRHAKSTFEEFAFHNNGLFNIGGTGAYPAPNTGVHELTHRAEDMGRFKAPSLRNIAVTAPYMHDGSIPTLEAVLDHYAAGGRVILSGPHAGDGRSNPIKSAFLKGFQLNNEERKDVLAFLHSLTDSDFLKNPAHASPWSATK